MKAISRSVVGALAGLAVLLTVTAVALGGAATKHAAKISIPDFSADELNAQAADDWLGAAGNLGGTRHSTLTNITPANVKNLKLVWHTKLNEPVPKGQDPTGLFVSEANQTEVGGTVFAMDSQGRVYALDATTGKHLWYFEPHNPKTPTPPQAKLPNPFGISLAGAALGVHRGVAVNDGLVYAFEESGNAVALNAETGKLVWHTQIAPLIQGVGLSMAPVYFDGKIFGGTAAGDQGEFPCLAFALDAKTGKELWRFEMIPGKKGDPGYETWAQPLPFRGGGAMWATPSVDPETGLVFLSTGNPIPYSGMLRGPGKEYYTDGLIALHADTGKEAWWFQEVHHDIWDADQSQQSMLFDGNYNGQDRKAVAVANKSGLWYVLDRTNGKPIIPVKEMPVQQSKEAHTWATQPIPATDPLVPQSAPDPKAWKNLKAPDGKPFNIGPGGPAGTFTAADSKSYSLTTGYGSGASSNKPGSVDPQAGLMFQLTTPGFLAQKALPLSERSKMSPFNFAAVADIKFAPLTGTPAAAIAGTRLSAMNLKTGKEVWKVDHLNSANTSSAAPGGGQKKKIPNNFSGGLISSPGIVWTSSANSLQAYNSHNGKLLWTSPPAKSATFSTPTTYSVDGKQYVTLLYGGTGDLYAYALP